MAKHNIPTYELPRSRPVILELIEDRPDDFVKKPHRHEFYEILWFKHGDGEHVVDFQPYPVRNDMIFFLAPGTVHHMNPFDKKGFLLVFSKDLMSQITVPEVDNFFKIFYSFDNAPYIRPVKDDLYKLGLLFELIRLEYTSTADDTSVLHAHLRAFLLHVQRIKAQTEHRIPEKDHERLVTLFHVIEDHYKTERKAAFYSNHLTLTPKRANEIVKARLGKTISQLVHERLLLEAKREMYFGKRNIKEIAYMLGFEDPAYFSRFFKKHTGSPPEQFKAGMSP